MTLATVTDIPSDIAAKKAASAEIIEAVLMKGDLSKLTNEERVSYYRAVCESVGLNPLTQPFQYLSLQGKLTLYARKDATEQLRRIHGIAIERLEDRLDHEAGVYIVTAYGKDRSGRTDASKGAVPIAGLKGEALSNAIMKAETKAKRRLTLSMAGLGWLDESEIDSIPRARGEAVDLGTGEIIDAEPTDRPKKTKPPKWARKSDEELGEQVDHPGFETLEVKGKVREESPSGGSTVESGAAKSGVVESETPTPDGDPAWLDLPMPKITSRPNWTGRKWRWVSEGKPDGDRAKWCSAVVDNPEAPADLKRKCEYLALRIAGLA
jgi:hypothetical protein